MNKDTFFDMPLSEGMQKTLADIGFKAPTPIQKKSIPEIMLGRDLLGQAQTGTGKTAAFSVPLIETVNESNKNIQALVVCPTRELCLQVSEEIKRLAAHKNGVSVVALYGGQAIDQQLRAIKNQRPQIIVATPGRLFDHLRRKSIDLSTVFMIVLDEADEMLDMGFREEIEQIFDLLPEENQRIFFSATMPKSIMDLVHNYLREPMIIKVESKALTVAKIAQSYYRVSMREKTELLCRVLDHRDPKLAVVFCNAKSTADEIVDQIKSRGFEAGVLHGDLSQNQRDRVMAKFKAGQVRVLVATDIAARGIDVEDIELVINYHLPHDPEDYVHRIGRTGRAGREGRAISMVEPRDNSRLRKIMHFAKTDILEEEPPSLNEVRSAKMASLFNKIKEALNSDLIPHYKSFVEKQPLSSEDLALGLIKIALEKFDDNSNENAFSESLKGRKYSGYTRESRGNGRDRREGKRAHIERRHRRDGFEMSNEDRAPKRPRHFADSPREKRGSFERQGRDSYENKGRTRDDREKGARESFYKKKDAPKPGNRGERLEFGSQDKKGYAGKSAKPEGERRDFGSRDKKGYAGKSARSEGERREFGSRDKKGYAGKSARPEGKSPRRKK